MTNIMRNTKCITDSAFDDYSENSSSGEATSSIIGIKPVSIILNEPSDDHIQIGLSKALDLVEEMNEEKFVILSNHR